MSNTKWHFLQDILEHHIPIGYYPKQPSNPKPQTRKHLAKLWYIGQPGRMEMVAEIINFALSHYDAITL